jgi:hypothetical protein
LIRPETREQAIHKLNVPENHFMPNIRLTPQRLVLEISGLSAAQSAADVQSLRFVESLTRDGAIEATLINWGGSPSGYTYSEGNAVQVGVQVKLTCGNVTLATGTIASVAPHFNVGVAPTFTFTATVKRPTASGSGTSLQLVYGMDLLEFHPALQPTGNLRRPSIAATGVASGLPALRAGVRLNINGLGSHWSGDYSVTETTHSFDVQHGYRVAFACSR